MGRPSVAAKKSAAVNKKEEVLKATLKKQVKQSANKTEMHTVDLIFAYCLNHPRAATQILNAIQLGSYDTLDHPGSNEDMDDGGESKLPDYVNKFRLLPKECSLHIIEALVPDLAWLRQISNKSTKVAVAEVLAFMVDVDISSAIPTKKIEQLQTWCQEQWVPRLTQINLFEHMCSMDRFPLFQQESFVYFHI